MAAPFICPNCLEHVTFVLPIEPLFTRDEVIDLVPCTARWLKAHQGDDGMSPPQYMKDDQKRLHRVFTPADLRYLRDKRLHRLKGAKYHYGKSE